MRDRAWQTEFYRRLGGHVRQWRAARGVTQAELADTLDIARPTLANIEAGRHRVPADFLWRAAAALKIAPKSLMPRIASSRAMRRRQRLAQRVAVLGSGADGHQRNRT